MRIRQLLAVAFVGSFVAVEACGGGIDSSCGSYFDALNSLATKCGAAPFFDPSLRAAFLQDCDALAKAPGASGLSGQIDACASKINSATCSLAGFSCVITGSLADGAACASSVQCTGGRCVNTMTNPTSEVSCGTCASYVDVGGNCPTGGECNPTSGTCVNGKCTAFLAQGAACGQGKGTCGTNLYCDATTTCQAIPTKNQACTVACLPPYKCLSGTCGDAVAENGPCPVGNECASTLTCDPQSKTCKASTTAQVGQPCGFVQNQNIKCVTDATCKNQVCVAQKPAGAACIVGNTECVPGYVCISGTCQIPDYTACK